MQLNEIKKGGTFRVIRVNPCNECVCSLMSLGLIPGEQVRLTHRAPLGDPIAVSFSGCHMSLRRCDAADVEVESV